MKVIHVISADKGGGAARATVDINNALNKAGINSDVLVQKKFSFDKHIHTTTKTIIQRIHFFFRFWFDYILILFFTKQTRGRFSFPIWGINLSKESLIKEADIIHLHWINQGYFSLNTFEKLAILNKTIVWTLHDMWAFTGGCHYSGGCAKYISECKNCPSLKFNFGNDFSNKIFLDKILTYKSLDINIVTCSKWLADEAKKSYLFQNKKITTIPNPIDPGIYKPVDKNIAREKLGLPKNKLLILFGTMNLKETRKGFVYLKKALQTINHDLKEKTELFVFGSSNAKDLDDINLKANFLGRISETDKLVYCYNAADVFVSPSIEDNLPNTVMESLSCGIPVVAFNIGGMPDMIDHKTNGYLAEPGDHISLAEGILWIIQNQEKKEMLSLNARKKVLENFIPEKIADMYLTFYKSLAQPYYL